LFYIVKYILFITLLLSKILFQATYLLNTSCLLHCSYLKYYFKLLTAYTC